MLSRYIVIAKKKHFNKVKNDFCPKSKGLNFEVNK